MAAKYVSSQVIKHIQKGARTLSIEYVDRTTSWVRPQGFPSPAVQADFVQVVEDNIAVFSPQTTKVAMKYVTLHCDYPVFDNILTFG
ncbi:hypothetical protein F4801DRAFT_571073 [Xylaria longipes]|nr:hypothetical protein F4801DRAFT_571073 [Xylaria longipes]